MASVDVAEPRPLANFSPSLWGDRFLNFSPDPPAIEAYAETIEGLKEEVRRMLMDKAMDSTQKITLLYTAYRLGLSYHFEKEINGQLEKLFNELNQEDSHKDHDLYTISIQFLFFRQHGYKMSCDVFNKFKDSTSGKLKETIASDGRGMLSLYEAAQLRVKGEEFLDEGLAFTTTNLEIMVTDYAHRLNPTLVKQVGQALRRPFHKGMPRLEARLYISTYEELCEREGNKSPQNELLLKLAKLDFNYLQLLHLHELSVVSKWWKDSDFASTHSYARNRLVESYFWIVGICFEPRCSQGRILFHKMFQLLVLIDDTYDAYGTLEELQHFAEAVDRWDVSAVDRLPDYMRSIYMALLNFYNELEEHLIKEGRSYAFSPSKEAMQDMVRVYYLEAQWSKNEDIPPIDDYMKVAEITSGGPLISVFGFVSMEEAAAKEAFDWLASKPKIVEASGLVSRLQDDIVTLGDEKERGPTASYMECYMKQYGTLREDAINEFEKRIEIAWKDINEEILKPMNISVDLRTRVFNYARMIDVIYKYQDGYTHANELKDYITLLFITQIDTC